MAHENLRNQWWCAKRFGVRYLGAALKRNNAASSRRTPKRFAPGQVPSGFWLLCSQQFVTPLRGTHVHEKFGIGLGIGIAVGNRNRLLQINNFDSDSDSRFRFRPLRTGAFAVRLQAHSRGGPFSKHFPAETEQLGGPAAGPGFERSRAFHQPASLDQPAQVGLVKARSG